MSSTAVSSDRETAFARATLARETHPPGVTAAAIAVAVAITADFFHAIYAAWVAPVARLDLLHVGPD